VIWVVKLFSVAYGKNYISIQEGGGWNLVVSWVWPCLPFSLSASSFATLDFHCSYLYSYYNSSRTLCIKCWDSAFRTELQHFILRYNKISLLCEPCAWDAEIQHFALSCSIVYWDVIKFPYFADITQKGG
jgi:hypothetical protein